MLTVGYSIQAIFECQEFAISADNNDTSGHNPNETEIRCLSDFKDVITDVLCASNVDHEWTGMIFSKRHEKLSPDPIKSINVLPLFPSLYPECSRLGIKL